MLRDNAIDLEPIALLPARDPLFRRAVTDIALLAGGLMASVDASLLAVPVPSDGWGDAMPVIVWDERLTPCPERGRALAETALFAPAIDALYVAADALFGRLDAWRWIHARVPGLCIVTDGTGALLACRPPGRDGDARALLDLARCDGAIRTSPLSDEDIWSRVAADAATFH